MYVGLFESFFFASKHIKLNNDQLIFMTSNYIYGNDIAMSINDITMFLDQESRNIIFLSQRLPKNIVRI